MPARRYGNFPSRMSCFPLMITVGIGTNLTDYAKVFTNPAYIVIIMATVIGAMIGTFIVVWLFHSTSANATADSVWQTAVVPATYSVSALHTAWS